MIHDLKPYPDYKASAMSWIGTIPRHWDEKRAKYLFREVDERSKTGKEELLSVSHITGVTPRSQKSVTMFLAESTVGHKVCRPGDLVINTLWAWMGALGVSPLTGLVSPAYGVYRPSMVAPLASAFIGHLLRSPPYIGEYLCRSTGIQSSRLRLYPEQLLEIPVVCPPFDEQRLMLRYLAYVDRRIRRYIGAKKKLIALLNEQKQATIHRVVTRGLDPSVALKPSGVEWLGDVPEHWEVAALRHRYSQYLGKMLDSKRNVGVHSLPYLRNTDVQWERINTTNLPLMDISPEEYERYTVKAGDLLVCEGGEVGRCAIWQRESDTYGFQKALHRLRPHSSDRDVPQFLLYLLRAAAKASAFADGHQSTIAHLTGDKLRAHRFIFPPKGEQLAIVEHLTEISGGIGRAVTATTREVELLREYRTRLIADVVTGKLDVREAAVHLPDEADASEPLDEADALTEDDDSEPDATSEEVEG